MFIDSQRGSSHPDGSQANLVYTDQGSIYPMVDGPGDRGPYNLRHGTIPTYRGYRGSLLTLWHVYIRRATPLWWIYCTHGYHSRAALFYSAQALRVSTIRGWPLFNVRLLFEYNIMECIRLGVCVCTCARCLDMSNPSQSIKRSFSSAISDIRSSEILSSYKRQATSPKQTEK